MENIESRKSAIDWYEHFLSVRPDDLIAEYRSVLKSDHEEPFPSIKAAMEQRAPTVKEELERRFLNPPCPECDIPTEETPPEVPGIFCPECGELW